MGKPIEALAFCNGPVQTHILNQPSPPTKAKTIEKSEDFNGSHPVVVCFNKTSMLLYFKPNRRQRSLNTICQKTLSCLSEQSTSRRDAHQRECKKYSKEQAGIPPFFHNLYTCHGCIIQSGWIEKLLDMIRDEITDAALYKLIIKHQSSNLRKGEKWINIMILEIVPIFLKTG